MKGLCFALVALFLYAIANTIIERKLSQISPLASSSCFYLGLILISAPLVLFRKNLGMELAMPQSQHFWLLVVCGALFFFADLCWFQAYHTGGKLEVITAAFLAFPLFTSLIKAVSDGTHPTKSDALSWAIVAIGLIVSIRQPIK